MSNKLLIILLTFSVELVMCFHNLAEMDAKHMRRMEEESLRGMMDMERPQGMDMRGMDMKHMRGMDMKHSRNMDMEHMRGMNDDEMRAWKARSNLFRVDAKGKGSPVKLSSKSNETKSKESSEIKEAQQPGTMQDERRKNGDKQAEQKPKKCKLNAVCYSNAQCGKRSICEPMTLADKKKKIGTCDCGICGLKIPLTTFCSLNKGPIALNPKLAIRQCAGLKNACRKDSLFTALETRKCNCEEGFKSAGFKNLEDGQKNLCDKQQCDGEKDTCHGMKCRAGKCNCNLADL